jgi:hypothetical protein
MSLTDEQIKEIHWSKPMDEYTYARAIESAATAPLLERIKELERDMAAMTAKLTVERGHSAQLEALRKDAERWAMLREESKRVDPVCALLWKKNSDRSSNRWVNVVDYDKQVDAAKEHP